MVKYIKISLIYLKYIPQYILTVPLNTLVQSSSNSMQIQKVILLSRAAEKQCHYG